MNLLPVQTTSSSMSLLPTSSTHSFQLPSSIYHNPTSFVLNILLSLPPPCPLSYSSLSIYLQAPVTCPYFLLPSISPNPFSPISSFNLSLCLSFHPPVIHCYPCLLPSPQSLHFCALFPSTPCLTTSFYSLPHFP